MAFDLKERLDEFAEKMRGSRDDDDTPLKSGDIPVWWNPRISQSEGAVLAREIIKEAASDVATDIAVESTLTFSGTKAAALGVSTTGRIGARVRRFFRRFRKAPRGLATSSNEAVFWSGVGRGGDKRAAAWVSEHGGATLETILANRGIKLPRWNPDDPAVVAAWRQASTEFAKGAKGHIRVLQGDSLRADAIFRDEFHALIANPNVKSITSINPESGAEALLWSR